MKILIVTDSYPPEIRSASKLIYELRIYLKNIGHHTDLITTSPKYNIDKSWVFEENLGLSKAINVNAIPHHNVSFILRGISHIIMPFQFYFMIRKKLKVDYDLCFIYSPPLTLGLVGYFLKMNSNILTVFNVQDLFPQNAIDLKILKNKFLIKVFKKIEKLCYLRNDVTTFHSNNNLLHVKKNYNQIDHSKFLVMHNWINFDEKSVNNERYVRKKYRISNHKKIAIFAGVLGPAQGLDNLIMIAEEVRLTKPNWHFLILGGGSDASRIKSIINERQLTNIQLEDFVNPQEYSLVLSGCDLGLVFLSNMNKTPVVPGKILGYMQSKKPIFCVANLESDAHEILSISNSGRSVFALASKDQILKEFGLLVDDDQHLSKLGENGYKFAKKNYEISVVVNKLFHTLKNIRKYNEAKV